MANAEARALQRDSGLIDLARSTDNQPAGQKDVTARDGTGSSGAKNYFTWDAEGMTTSAGPLSGLVGSTSLVSTEKHGGAKSMQIVVAGDDGGNQPLGADGALSWTWPGGQFVGSGWTYYRWWMKMAAGFSWGTGTQKAKASRIKRADESPPPVYTGYVAADGVFVGECDRCAPGGTDPSKASVGYDFTKVPGTGWHEYIVAVKANSTVNAYDGEFHFYVDGKEIGSGVGGMRYYDLAVGNTEAWGAWLVKPYFQLNATASDGGTIWLDDFSADDGWNSLLPQ